MTIIQLEKTLFEMINNSKMIINRADFRTLYLIDDIKKVRYDKLNKLFNSNYVNKKNMKFSKCDYFISIYYTSDYVRIDTNKEINNMIRQLFNDNNNDIINFFKNFFLNYYNLDFSDRFVKYCSYIEDIHLDEKKFETSYEYKNSSENKTLVFSFAKYKFDICNYSYKRIVNLFKK